MKSCRHCHKILTTRHQKIYCSNQCQKDYEYLLIIEKWLKDCDKGVDNIKTKNISKHIKKYLVKKSGEKCILCGWGTIHPVTKRVPLEVDHIDGNSNNNHYDNLRLLCPNCHSLTPRFRNLNRGHGRKWRLK